MKFKFFPTHMAFRISPRLLEWILVSTFLLKYQRPEHPSLQTHLPNTSVVQDQSKLAPQVAHVCVSLTLLFPELLDLPPQLEKIVAANKSPMNTVIIFFIFFIFIFCPTLLAFQITPCFL